MKSPKSCFLLLCLWIAPLGILIHLPKLLKFENEPKVAWCPSDRNEGAVIKMHQSDPCLHKLIRENHVILPSKKNIPLSLENPTAEQSMGQAQTIMKMLQNKIPSFLLQEFTYQQRVDVIHLFDGKSATFTKTRNKFWSSSNINSRISLTLTGSNRGSYGLEASNKIRQAVTTVANVEGNHILVIGSKDPWVEAILLASGASHVTTLEYGKISTDHPHISTMQPHEFAQDYLAGRLPVFDGVVSFSSLEHSGLGRYGDMLNPYGDLIAMARAWCVIKDGGFAIIGLPVGPDSIVFNKHRIYGHIMLPHLFANWEQVYTDTPTNIFQSEDYKRKIYDGFTEQPIHVLRKNESLFHL